ncbi:MAG TPA: nucleotidyltransferase family protein [Flavitalea sp.]|nr:nucleotidyltransferase family protein [Flavitalea sp.]
MNQKIHYNIIILAAGASTRLGKPKQLLEHNGHNLIQHAIDEALDTEAQKVIGVLGAGADNIIKNINRKQAHILYNEKWEEGMASSVRSAIEYTQESNHSIDAAILMVCDQPYVTSALLMNLVREHVETGKSIVASQYKDTLGTPVFFHKTYFGDLLKLKGDTGAKKIIMDNREEVRQIIFPLGDIDIDSMADYKMLLQKNGGV